MPAIISAIIFSIALIFGAVTSLYIVPEGHMAVITHWGEAKSQEAPSGIKLRNPISTGVIEFDVRERRLAESMDSATQNQLPIVAEITLSWRIDPSKTLEIYQKYGSLEAFEAIVLQPRVRQAAKAGLSQYQASDLIRDRTAAADTILTLVNKAMVNYPALIASLQIEQVVLPQRYLDAVMAKEEARESAAREDYVLQQQKLKSQQEVQTAEAERDAARARADGEAYRIEQVAQAEAKSIKLRGEAQAATITAQQKAIAGNTMIIDYEKARRWNGQMPQTMMGEAPNMLMQLN